MIEGFGDRNFNYMTSTPITDEAYMSALSCESKVDSLLACSEKLERRLTLAYRRIDILESAHRKILKESHDARAVDDAESALSGM